MPQAQCLSQLPPGGWGRVSALGGGGTLRRRLLDLGLSRGTAVQALGRSPAGDPTAYWIRGTVIALRAEDAGQIAVEPIAAP